MTPGHHLGTLLGLLALALLLSALLHLLALLVT